MKIILLFSCILGISLATVLNRLLIIEQLHLSFHIESVFLSFLQGSLLDLIWVASGFFLLRWKRLAIGYLLILLTISTMDSIYFYYTFSHLEPILWQHTNIISLYAVLSEKTVLLLIFTITALVGIGGLLFRYLPNTLNYLQIGMIAGIVLSSITASWLLKQGHFNTPGDNTPWHEKTAQQFALDRNKQESENNHKKLLAISIYNNFVQSIYSAIQSPPTVTTFQPYTATEKSELAALGLLNNVAQAPQPAVYEQIILVTIESLHRNFLHHYNQRVPTETTIFLDSLIAQYPHLDNYFTSAMPTKQGLNAILTSQLDLRPEFSVQQGEENLFDLLQTQAKMEGFFISPITGEYNYDYVYYPRLYRMNHFIAGEQLDERYFKRKKTSLFHGWGYGDAVVYEEGLRLLRQQQNKPTFLLLTTIDSHAPYLCQEDKNSLPERIRQHVAVDLLCVIYHVDKQLKVFVEQLQTMGWLDNDKHLLVITADHAPYVGGEHFGVLETSTEPQLGKIPLIFISKNSSPFNTLNSQQYASEIDLAPTLLDVTGIATPPQFFGSSLLKPRHPEFAVSFYRAIEGETLYYRQADVQFEVDLLNTQSFEYQAVRKWFNNRYAVVGK